MKSFRNIQKQKGLVLFVALIAMVAMLLAGIALMRSTDTANVLAGNFAFKESSLQAADLGMDMAFAALPTLATTGNVPVQNQYFTVMQPVNAAGVPNGINWQNVPKTPVPNTGNSVQYVIERMCQGTPTDTTNGPVPTNITDIAQYCVTVPTQSLHAGSMSVGDATFTGSGTVYYRTTVLVTGPRGATSMVQGVISL